jgi:hypothetical protein
MKSKRVLLLSGSYRCRKTTTNSILDYVEDKLSISGISIFREQVSFVIPDMQFVTRTNDVLQKCNTIILCFPLYFDSLPYPLLSAFELLSNQSNKYNRIDMFSIVHCGLPEPAHCDNALTVCKIFSEKMGFNHAGCAIIPDTGAIDGSPIEKNKRIVSVLNKVIDVVTCYRIIDNKVKFIGKPSMYPIFFRMFGNIIMKNFARKNNVSVFQKGCFN